MKFAVALVGLACLFALALGQADTGCEYCVDKVCGPNGIGGSCGTCPAGQRCYRGACICDRDCTARECGPDACGTSCGECLPGQTCVNSICTGACTPQCVSSTGRPKNCGWDRCGGNCGSCPEGFKCKDGECLCKPHCEDKHCGPDGCGGTCGVCEDGAFCQGDNDPFPGECYVDCFVPIPFTVTDCDTGVLIDGATVEATSDLYLDYSLTFVHFSTGTTWTPVGFSGTYSFFASATGYISDTLFTPVTRDTTSLTMCLSREAFCGDGQCNGGETANPTQPTRCGDCGRIRGVISLAVGQKDQLNNITIDVWAHPTNPALNLRAGTPVPAPDFSTISDSKGFFSAGVLNFDAPAESVAFGSFSRRFYFRLSGTFVDRTDGTETEITLLPLWWNYELTNLQYSGSGDVAGSNNSPSFYFYMTPPFPTADALVRVILSWGTLRAQSAISIPDIDLVVAGPVTQESLNTYNNTGVVNFSNKDIHSEINELPFVKIITDSAQSFGPEVIDFYGNPATPELDIGFSPSYAPGAAANVYEIWVDKPNSQPNEELVFNFIAETNAFLVYYINDGAVNEQLLFDAATGVEYAYGFWNGDQWNQVPADATLWHVTDISEDGIVFEGFSTVANEPGTKYGFDAGFFEPQKTLPCGHVAARGATPSYCPAILDYPQSNKK